MMNHNIYIYIAIMALVSFCIRVLPLTLIRKQIKSQFLQSFLYYVPYVTLAVMTFPACVVPVFSRYPSSAVLSFLSLNSFWYINIIFEYAWKQKSIQ